MDSTKSLRILLASLLAILILAPERSEAQNNPLNEDHVTWDYVTPTLEGEPGETVVFKFKANLKPKVHLYTQKTYPDSIFGPTPTELSAGGSKVVKKAGGLKANKSPVSGYDENFETETAFWKGGVTFSVPLKIATDATPGSTEDVFVNLYYQTCDDNSCKPPLDSRFDFKVKILEPEPVAIDTVAVRDSLHRVIVAAVGRTVGTIDQVMRAEKVAGDADSGSETLAAVDGENPGTGDDTSASSDEGEGSDDEEGESADGSDGETGTTLASVSNTDDDDPLTVREEVEQSIDKGLFAYIALAMGFGLIALATPCVFPMIPITISFFTKREQTTRAQSIRDATVYGAGIIFTFTALGTIVAAIYGAAGVGQIATNPIINILIAGIFLAFALSLFGLFEIQVPSSILNKLNTKANSGGGGIGSILLMGFVFSLTSFTCTVPFVGTVLAGVGEGASWFWPIVGMLAFSAIFALPFVLLALFPSLMKAMPKSGGWLNAVKVTMGFVEVAAAMKFLSNTDLVWDWGILTRELVLSVWIAVAILATIYLLGKFRLPHDAPMEKVGVVRMLFSMFFLAVSFYLLTGLFGGRLGELDAFLPPQEYPGKGNTSIFASISAESERGAQAEEGPLEGNRIMAEGMEWVQDDYAAALVEAKETGKPLFIDFTGYTCTNCRWMEVNVFTKKEVQDLMKQYVLVRLYTDRREESNVANRQMQIDRFQTIDLPFYVTMTPDDEVIGQTEFTRDEEKFLKFLKRGLEKSGKGGSREVASR